MKILIFLLIVFFGLWYYLSRRETFLDYTDPELIKMVLNQNDYTAEKKVISYSDMKAPQHSVRYFLDEHLHDFIEPIPFAPHTILNSYDDVDISSKVTIAKDDKDIDDLDKSDDYVKETYEDDYCVRHKHLVGCVLGERNYKCFGKIEFTQRECEAETDIIGNRVEPGVWDRRCVADEDCPFYRANVNYPNDFGKCQNGYCQLPKGLKPIGYRKYQKNSLPLCYNCIDKKTNKRVVDTCCSEQHHPDYVFENDLKTRYKVRKQLEEKGLSTITTDNYEAEFRELEKKLKI